MNKDIIFALTRHLLTLIGGGLATRYAIDGTTLDAASGAILTLVGVAWSIYEKRARL